jgi:hypothetical protein
MTLSFHAFSSRHDLPIDRVILNPYPPNKFTAINPAWAAGYSWLFVGRKVTFIAKIMISIIPMYTNWV